MLYSIEKPIEERSLLQELIDILLINIVISFIGISYTIKISSMLSYFVTYLANPIRVD